MPLKLHVIPDEQFDPETNTFYTPKPQTIVLEHSLISISRWESKWHKSYLETEHKTREEVLDYVRCMTLTSGVDPRLYLSLPAKTQNEIVEYLNDPATATVLKQQKTKGGKRDKVTSELIYYWMTIYNIPFECEKWNIKRLLVLIQICSAKSTPPKKVGKNQMWQNYSQLNNKRKAAMHTRG